MRIPIEKRNELLKEMRACKTGDVVFVRLDATEHPSKGEYAIITRVFSDGVVVLFESAETEFLGIAQVFTGYLYDFKIKNKDTRNERTRFLNRFLKDVVELNAKTESEE